jgi:hypothetical protein
MGVATHTVRNHQEATGIQYDRDCRCIHVASKDTVANSNGVLVIRTHAATVFRRSFYRRKKPLGLRSAAPDFNGTLAYFGFG